MICDMIIVIMVTYAVVRDGLGCSDCTGAKRILPEFQMFTAQLISMCRLVLANSKQLV